MKIITFVVVIFSVIACNSTLLIYKPANTNFPINNEEYDEAIGFLNYKRQGLGRHFSEGNKGSNTQDIRCVNNALLAFYTKGEIKRIYVAANNDDLPGGMILISERMRPHFNSRYAEIKALHNNVFDAVNNCIIRDSLFSSDTALITKLNSLDHIHPTFGKPIMIWNNSFFYKDQNVTVAKRAGVNFNKNNKMGFDVIVDKGKIGRFIGLKNIENNNKNLSSVAYVKWDSQKWTIYKTNKTVELPSFISSINISYLKEES